MTTRIVIGHTNPDTDSIGSAILFAQFETALGRPTEAKSLGELNAETRYVLERFGIDAPGIITSVAGYDEVFIVDHTEKSQAPADLRPDQIAGIVDHHKLGDLQSSKPIFAVFSPVGSTATILVELFASEGIEMSDALKGLALSCILSDTVILKSPTTTDTDRAVVERLSRELGIDPVELGKEQFAAKADFSAKMPSEVIGIDMKPYSMGGKTFAIAQVEVPDVSIVMEAKAAYLEAMRAACEANSYGSFVLLVTDIIREGSEVLVFGMEDEVGAALGVDIVEHSGFVPGLMSRKKQVVPPLEAHFG